jgi:hypothetical protein
MTYQKTNDMEKSSSKIKVPVIGHQAIKILSAYKI